MIFKVPFVWIAALLLVPPGRLRAETIDWSIGRAIDCPLQQSLPNKVLTRTILFPGGMISECPSFWSEEQMYIKIIKNTVVIELRDPLFSATLQVYDDHGNLYLVNAHAAGPADSVDEILMLRPAQEGATRSVSSSTMLDSDGQISEMMAAMAGGEMPADVISQPVTSVEHGALHQGRILLHDSVCQMELVRVFQGRHLRGYECVLRARTAQVLHLDEQRLWFDGALAVYASSHVLSLAHGVAVDLQKDQAITLFYVVE